MKRGPAMTLLPRKDVLKQMDVQHPSHAARDHGGKGKRIVAPC